MSHQRKKLKRLAKVALLRNQSGGFTALSFVALVPLLVALLAFGLDFKHHQTAQQQLQKATDAAALAGAEMLWYDGTYSIAANAYMPDSSHTAVTNAALAMAQLNVAEGQSVSNDTPGVTVKITVTDPVLPTLPQPIAVVPPSLQNLGITKVPSILNQQIPALFAATKEGSAGSVEVTATMQVRNMFGVIFGHGTDTITAYSKAGSAGPAYSVNAGQLFPVGISWLSVPSIGLSGTKILLDMPLVLKRIGDPIVVNISPTLDQNAAFTNFDTNAGPSQYVPHAIDQYLGIVPLETSDSGGQKKVIPPIAVGDSINMLYDSTASNKLVSQAQALRGKVLYMPVVVTNLPLAAVTGILLPDLGALVNNVNNLASQLLGLNQVIGFAAVKVDGVSVSGNGIVTINGLLVNGQRFGSNKPRQINLLPALLNSVLSLIGISGGDLLPKIGKGQTYPLTATQAVKLLQ